MTEGPARLTPEQLHQLSRLLAPEGFVLVQQDPDEDQRSA